jgi:hypothetical protein
VLACDLEFAALPLDLAEQVRVVDGERRLGGKVLQQPHRLGRKRTGRLAAHQQGTDRLVAMQQRHGQQCLDAGPPQDIEQRIVASEREIGKFNCGASLDTLAHHRSAATQVLRAHGGDELIAHIVASLEGIGQHSPRRSCEKGYPSARS